MELITGAVLLAQAGAAATPEWLTQALVQFGATGVLAGVLFYLYTRQLKEHREDMAAERKLYADWRTQDQAAWGTRYDRLEAALERNEERSAAAFDRLREAIDQLRWSREVSHDPEFRDRTAAQNDVLAQEAKAKRPGRA